MDVARLVLDYLQALIWPALIVFFGFRFREPLSQFLERLTSEGTKVMVGPVGVELGAEVAARQQERIATLAEQSETADPAQLRESAREKKRESDRDSFVLVTSDFLKLPYGTRRKEVARDIADITETMDLDDILQFARSPRGGERAGAAIGLRVHLQRFDTTQQDPRLPNAIRGLMDDRFSTVRYRAAEALSAAPQLASQLAEELRRLAENDENRDVRTMARKALP